MKLFLCIDDEGGMTFMDRRVSLDGVVTDDIAAIAGEGLSVFPYSERLFKEAGYSPRVIKTNADAPRGDGSLFIEERSPAAFLDGTDTVVIYKWNRLYPSDLQIDFSPIDEGFVLTESVDMVGVAHEKITRETYTR